MASLHPRRRANGDVSWRVLFRIGGKQAQETFNHEKGALEFIALVDRVGGDAARRTLEARRENAGVPTLREWTARYLDPTSGLLTGIEPGTRRDYQRIAERSFLPILGDMPVNAIEKPDIGRWIEWQERQPSGRVKGATMAAKTVRNYHGLLSSILTAAVEAKYSDSNAAHRTRLSKGGKREGVFLSRPEFQTLLERVPDRYRGFVLFLAGTGVRWGEATALTWGDINLHTTPPTVRIDKAWKKTAGGPAVLGIPKSSKSRRTVSLWPELVDALGTPGPAKSLVFAADKGGKLWPGRFHDSTWRPTVKAANDAGMEKTPTIHDLRHTHASWLIAAGAPLPFVQARLGHEKITTTVDTYGHLLPDAHVQMSAIMQDTLAGALSSPLALEA
ncbi:tyrosine-type recombinase/integrase [Agrococcus sp. DT81.2]|uniref:tyrosine-type recombinase/integrase n=1 Tax=Agrococcus sp. DT81.2 TaxID=3393414 RepID=UPI003CE496B0